MPAYTGINHMAMATGDIEATIRFWRDLLGMRMIAGIGQKDFQIYFFEAGADMIGFFPLAWGRAHTGKGPWLSGQGASGL